MSRLLKKIADLVESALLGKPMPDELPVPPPPPVEAEGES